MNPTRVWSGAAVALTLGVAASLVHGEQSRRGPAAETVIVKVSLKVGEQFMTSTGPGTCTHAPKASIYNVPSEMWTARQEAETRSTQLTLWRPAGGKEEMFSLSLSGAKNIDISTVRGGKVTGSGTVKLAPEGKGGRFTIDAKAKSGEAINGTIECTAFTAAIAEGG